MIWNAGTVAKTVKLGCWSSRLEKLHCVVCRLHVLNNAKILELVTAYLPPLWCRNFCIWGRVPGIKMHQKLNFWVALLHWIPARSDVSRENLERFGGCLPLWGQTSIVGPNFPSTVVLALLWGAVLPLHCGACLCFHYGAGLDGISIGLVFDCGDCLHWGISGIQIIFLNGYFISI